MVIKKMNGIECSIIACVDNKGGISKDGRIPWSLKNDMQFFRDMVFGKICVMGRKTWDSITKNCKSYLLHNTRMFLFTNKLIKASESDQCIQIYPKSGQCDEFCKFVEMYPDEDVMICGGQDIYDMAIQKMNTRRIYLTRVMMDYHCDKFFQIPTNFHMENVGYLKSENDIFYKMISYVPKTVNQL